MAVTHICKQEKNENFNFFLKFEKFKKISKKIKISKKNKIFIVFLFTYMCYGHDEDIKSHFLTQGKPKKTKTKSK